MMIALPLICLVTLAFGRDAFRPDWPHAAEKMIVVAVLGIALNAFFFRHPLEARLADPSVPHGILVAWLGAGVVRAWGRRDVLRPAWQRRPWWARGVLLVLAAPIALLVAALLSDDTYRRLDKSSLVERFGKGFERAEYMTGIVRASWPVDSAATQEGTMKLAAYIRACTSRSDRVFMTPYLPQVLAMADRAFAGGHADLRADFFDTEAEQRQTLERLQRQTVPMVVFDDGQIPGFRESFPLITRYLDERYVSAGTRQIDERRSITLLVERNRPAPRTWEPLDWPCFR
jgi:hypothetical protein